MTEPISNWPEQLDAVIAALEHHRLLLKNESVRVLESRIEPGEIVRLHTHRWPAVYYFISTGEFVRRGADGEVQFDSRLGASPIQPGQSVWSPPLGPHTLENVGATAIHAISVELIGR